MTDILIVEDNQELAELLKDFLEAEQYTVKVADTGERALALYLEKGAKLVVLDIMLPGMDGFAVCQKIRATDNTPILIVSAKIGKEDKLNGLLLGADDYIEKPYDIDLLLAKINGIFRRRYDTGQLVEGEIILDKQAHQLFVHGQEVDVTAKEWELLLLLMENKGKTLSKEMLFHKVWGFDSFSEPQTLTVHIKWLRQKIEADAKAPEHIKTIWGVGYRFE